MFYFSDMIYCRQCRECDGSIFQSCTGSASQPSQPAGSKLAQPHGFGHGDLKRTRGWKPEDGPNSEQDLAIGVINDAPVVDVDTASIDSPLTADDDVDQAQLQPQQALEPDPGSDNDQRGSAVTHESDIANSGGAIDGATSDNQQILDTDEGTNSDGTIIFGDNGGSLEQRNAGVDGVESEPGHLQAHVDTESQQREHEQGQSGTLQLDRASGRRDIDEFGDHNRTYNGGHFLLTEHEGPVNTGIGGNSSSANGRPISGSEIITGIHPDEPNHGVDYEHTYEHIPFQLITTPKSLGREPDIRATVATTTRTLDNSGGAGSVNTDGEGTDRGTDHSEHFHQSGNGEPGHGPGVGSGDHLPDRSGLVPGGHLNPDPDGGYVIHEGSGSQPDHDNNGNLAIDKGDGSRHNHGGSGDRLSTTLDPIFGPNTPRLAILPTPAQSGNGESELQTTTTHSIIEGPGESHSSGDNPGGGNPGEVLNGNHPDRPSSGGHLVSGEGHIGAGGVDHEGSGHEGIHEGSGNGEENGENKGNKPGDKVGSSTIASSVPLPTIIPVMNPDLIRTSSITLFPSSSLSGSGVNPTHRQEQTSSTQTLPLSSSIVSETPYTTEHVRSTTAHLLETDSPWNTPRETESLKSSLTESSVPTVTHTVQVEQSSSIAAAVSTPSPGVPVIATTIQTTFPESTARVTPASENPDKEMSVPPSSLSTSASPTSSSSSSTTTVNSEIPFITTTTETERLGSTTTPTTPATTTTTTTEPVLTTLSRTTTRSEPSERTPPPETEQSSSGSSTRRQRTTTHRFTSPLSSTTSALSSAAISIPTTASSSQPSPSTAAGTTTTQRSTMVTSPEPTTTSITTTRVASTIGVTSAVTNPTTTTRVAPLLTFASTAGRMSPWTTLTSQSTTRMPTTKKRATHKSTEKPQEGTSTTTPTERPIVITTTGSPAIPGVTATTPRTTILPGTSRSPPEATEKPQSPSSTPPPLFIWIEIQMSWSKFCSIKTNFTASLKEIIRTEKQVMIRDEQIRLPNLPRQYCDIPSLIAQNEASVDSIHVKMYIVDEAGKVDIQLTIDAFHVIDKGGFRDTSFFKGKILNVQVVSDRPKVDGPQPDAVPQRTQKESGVTMVIVIASVGGFCCLMLILLQVVLIHRRVKAKAKLRSPPKKTTSYHSNDNVALGAMSKSRPNSGYWNPAIEEDEAFIPFEYTHVLNYSTLANFCVNVNAIYEEFQNIPCENSGLTKLFVGEDEKNRFANVLPHSHSRVKLKMREGDTSDYINASYIKGFRPTSDTYIATQSPLVNTVEDFWRMVWEQQSRVIIMLNPKLPTGKYKQSTCYWPDSESQDSIREYGDYTVALKKRLVHKDYIECRLEITDIERNLKRDVHHFLLTCWPDAGSPEPLSIVKFVLDTRPYYEDGGPPPIVHCGPGTGRTGSLIAVDICMRMYEMRKHVDFLNTVYRIRKDRLGMVQTKEQYALIYQALNEYAVILGSPSISSRSSVITLHAML